MILRRRKLWKQLTSSYCLRKSQTIKLVVHRFLSKIAVPNTVVVKILDFIHKHPNWKLSLVLLLKKVTLMILLEGFLVIPIISLTKNLSKRVINVTFLSKRTKLNTNSLSFWPKLNISTVQSWPMRKNSCNRNGVCRYVGALVNWSGLIWNSRRP